MSDRYIFYYSGYKYQLKRPFAIQLEFSPPKFILTEYIRMDTNGYLYVKDGYAWDGPSGPTVDTSDFMRGSLVHDALYQLMREGHLDAEKYRKLADDALRTICREDGMSWIRATYVWTAVRFAGSAAVSQRPELLVAP